MGKCAADVAAMVIQHPGDGNVERLYWPTTAEDVLPSNPGHYASLMEIIRCLSATVLFHTWVKKTNSLSYIWSSLFLQGRNSLLVCNCVVSYLVERQIGSFLA
jgi:hypothetical protein